jgi:inorganic pyrophosphatase
MERPLYRPHPWHGVPIGEQAPERVTVYVEIVPTDTVKYEIDKASGYLKVDRPQKFSNVCPTLYGFVPQTLCGPRVGGFCAERAGRAAMAGDGDPLDICVLTERTVTHGDILLQAIPVGGLRMIESQQADDKIVAVLAGDAVYGALRELEQLPAPLLDRLRHYFLTYKQEPGATDVRVEIAGLYGRGEAHEVIRRSREDYRAEFPQS